ncbi:MAG: hypothetical protein HOP29_15710 [Phycisphaerales bacterium]|nr:hypothetical protein [Phycisphaerales bacterium]
MRSRKVRKYGGRGQIAGAGGVSSVDLIDFQTPHDAARAFVFQHPEIRNLAPTLAGVVQDIIDSTPELDDFATAIAAQGPADTDSGWMRLVPVTNDDGTPALDSAGSPLIQQDPSQDTLDAAQRVILSVLRRVPNEPDLEGSNWHGNVGRAFVNQSAPTVAGAAFGVRQFAASAGFRAALSFPADTAVPNDLYGLLFRAFNADADRSFSVVVENIYLRSLDAWVEFRDAGGVSLPVEEPTASDLPDQQLKFLSALPSNSTIMGIPLLDDDTLRHVTLAGTFPADATTARLVFGTLGLGGPVISPAAYHASVRTLVINLAIPTFLLALGIGIQYSGVLQPILEDPEFLAGIAAAAAFLDAGGSFAYVASTGDWQTVFATNANLILTLLLTQSPKFAAALLGYASGQELTQAIPFVGWAI